MGLSNLILFGSIKEIARDLIFRDIRIFLAELLSLLYSIVGVLLQIIYAVADLDNSAVFSEMYSGIQERFYIIIGVVMLFKVSMSMITYFANPDKFTDKEAGMGKVITRMITVLILLIFVPTFVFPFLGEIQPKIIETVGKVVMDSDFALNPDTAHSAGQNIATTIFSGFFTYNEECGESGGVAADNILDMAITYAEEACPNDKKMFKYRFNWLMALIAIVPIVAIIIIIGVQVAIRAFKLIILKVLAPIPIIYYMDPKSMKDGGKTSAYMKLFIATYLDLFIHFAALFFAVALMDRLSLGIVLELFKVAGDTYILGLVFIVIGLLLFAFQAPKFVKKAIGLKDSEFGSGLAGLLTTGAAMAGAVGSGAAAFGASAKAGGNFIQNFGAAASSAIRGGQAGYKAAGDKGDFGKALGAIRAKNVEMAADRAAGVNFGVRAKELFGSTFMGAGPGARMMSEVEDLDKVLKAFKDMKSGLDPEAAKGKYGTVRTNKVAGYDWIYGKSKDFAGVASVAKSQQLSEFEYNYTDERGVTHNQTIQTKDADWIQGELAKAESAKLYDLLTGHIDPAEAREIEFSQYIDTARSGNPDLEARIGSLEKLYEMGGLKTMEGIGEMEQHFAKLGDQMKAVEKKSLDTKNSTEYLAAQAAAKKK